MDTLGERKITIVGKLTWKEGVNDGTPDGFYIGEDYIGWLFRDVDKLFGDKKIEITIEEIEFGE